jgi:hypothetical protein
MKKLLYFIAIMLMVAPVFVMLGCTCEGLEDLGCQKEKAIETLTVEIVEQPQGGQNVQTLSCTYTATYFPDTSYSLREDEQFYPVTLKVSWMNDKGGQYQAEERTFAMNDVVGGTYKVTKTTGQPNLFFDKTFWLRCSWKDSHGVHDVVSEQAVCTVR